MERIEWSARAPWWMGVLWMVSGTFCFLLLVVMPPIRHTPAVIVVRWLGRIWNVGFFLAGLRLFVRGLCSTPAQWRRVRTLGWGRR